MQAALLSSEGKNGEAAVSMPLETLLTPPASREAPAAAMYANRVQHLTRYSYLSGLTGSAVLIALGVAAAQTGALQSGWRLFSLQLTPGGNPAIFAALITCALAMFAVELCVRRKVEGGLIALSPKLREGRIASFIGECLGVYALEALLLWAAYQFFSHANAYSPQIKGFLYLPWLQLLYGLLMGYLALGLPYVLLTRGLAASPEEDAKSPFMLALRCLHWGLGRLGGGRLLPWATGLSPEALGIGRHDKIIATGLMVKLFFVPLMTIFFVDQFTHFVSNWDYLARHLAQVYSNGLQRFAHDFYNISFTFLLTLDVGLAWAGYTLSSRWIKNTYVSVEPTFLGWFVALVCYPPFSDLLGTYFTVPSEKAFLMLPSHTLVLLFAVMSIASYVVYVSATAVFGLRFSNLTHRGIIDYGPYRFVRHPAYAAKNFAWWCVMMPAVIYQAHNQQKALILLELLGLATMTFLYYWRALTEERHLSQDPVYRDYCQRVRYRFIPGVL